jgi:arabinofuranosyltransferase
LRELKILMNKNPVNDFFQEIRCSYSKLHNTCPWIGIAIALLAVILIQGFAVPFQPFDDAFITYRYARNLRDGFGFVYNEGERVLGTTTPLFTLLLSLFAVLTGPDTIPEVSHAISIIADAINVWLLFRLVKILFKNEGIAFLVAVTFLLQPFRLQVVNGGMETSLYLTSLLFTYYSYIQRKPLIFTSISAATTFMLRPDGVLALAPVFLDWFINEKQSFLKAIIITIALISPWLIWSTHYFGIPIPHSVIAKNAAYRNPPGHAAVFLLTFIGTGTQGPYTSPFVLLPFILFGLPILTLGTFILYKRTPRALIISTYPIIYSVVMSLGNPSMMFSWYFIPLIPGLLVLAMGLIWFGLKAEKRKKIVLASLLSLLLIVLPSYLLIKYPSSLISRTRESAFGEACDFLLNYDLRGKQVLAPDIGVVGWCLEDVNIIDPIGLVSPDSLPYIESLPSGQLVSFELIRDEQPDYIISLDHFMTPDILNKGVVEITYKLIYEDQLPIGENDHALYIFQIRD